MQGRSGGFTRFESTAILELSTSPNMNVNSIPHRTFLSVAARPPGTNPHADPYPHVLAFLVTF
jgi:hypothetical protein